MPTARRSRRADVAAQGVDQLVLLGDIVGYGADPEWCRDRAEALVAEGAHCVRGNHDNAASGAVEAMSFLAKRALEWTAGRLSAGQKAFLRGLPFTADAEGVLFVHASANPPEAWSYVTSGAVVPGLHGGADPVRACACPDAGQLRQGRCGARAGLQAGLADPLAARPEVAGGDGLGGSAATRRGAGRRGAGGHGHARADLSPHALRCSRSCAEGARGGIARRLGGKIAGGTMMQRRP